MHPAVTPILRYSPKPIEGYHGPAHLTLLASPEAWNLAYLSHPFEKKRYHKDPQFSVHVWNSLRTNLSTGQLERIPGSEHLTLQPLLRMPAPWLVRWFSKNSKITVNLPLYKAYGQAWLITVEQRSWGCGTYEDDPADEVGENLDDAKLLLARF